MDHQTSCLATASWTSLPRLLRCGHVRIHDAGAYHRQGPWNPSLRYGVLQLTLAGQGLMEDAEGVHRVRPGQAFVLRLPDKQVSWRADPAHEGEWEFLWLNFDGGGSEAIVDELVTKGGHIHALDPALDAVARWKALAGRGGIIPLASAEGAAVVWELLGACVAALPTDRAEHQGAQLAQSALQHIRNAHSIPGDVQSLAAELHTSREHLSRLLRRHLGLTPSEILGEERLRRAKVLLRTTDQPLRSIAQAVGLADAGQLVRLLRRATGMTPGAFRLGDGE